MLNQTNFSQFKSMMESLEERVMFDGVPDATFILPGSETASQVPAQAQLEQVDFNAPRELILIDAGVEDGDRLLAGILESKSESILEVRFLDGDSNGIDQISEILSSADHKYDAIHILSHGSEGSVALGNTELSTDNLSHYANQLAGWADALTEDADLLFYGCDLAGNHEGEQFIESISAITGSDVAASDDLTGGAELGGDWDLELNVGTIETVALTVENWNHVLGSGVAVQPGNGSEFQTTTATTDVFFVGNNTNGNGDSESGFNATVNGAGGTITSTLNFNNPTPASTAFNGGTFSVSDNTVGDDPTVNLTTNNGFQSGTAGNAVQIDPVSTGNGTVITTITFDVTTPSNAFAVDIIDTFDVGNNTGDVTLEFFVDGVLQGSVFAPDMGPNVTTATYFDANGVSLGTGTVGNGQENFFGVISSTNFSTVEIVHTSDNTGPGRDLFALDSIRLANVPIPEADLVTVKTLASGDATPEEGDTVSFDITVTNNGGDQATNVSLIDSLPAGITFTGSSVTQGVYNSATGLFDIGTLNVGQSATLTLTGTVDVGQGGNTIINTTTAATGDQMDPTNAGDDLDESIDVNVFLDKDWDGIVDSRDADADGDGILDVDEGFVGETTTAINSANLNSPGFPLNTPLQTGNTAQLNGLFNGLLDFSAELINNGIGTPGFVGGIQIQPDPIIGGNLLFVQPDGTGDFPDDAAVYTFDFNSPVDNLSFISSGINFGDTIIFEAFFEGNPVPVTAANFSNFTDGVVVQNGNELFNPAGAGGTEVDENRATVTFTQRIDQIILTTGKGNGANSTVTLGFNAFSGDAVTGAGSFIDTDGDGISDHCDIDSDNDGISDLLESGNADAIAADTDGSGVIDNAEAIAAGFEDLDGDGAWDGLATTPVDTDGDGIADFLDLDSDNDGIADAIEAQPTAGYQSPAIGSDADGDGVVDTFDDPTVDHGGAFTTPEDTDGDGIFDFLDADSDNDGVSDTDESGLVGDLTGIDANGDGIDDGVAPDSYADTDGIVSDPINDLENTTDNDTSDVDYRSVNDKDWDGVADHIDQDDDNDGILDTVESPPVLGVIDAASNNTNNLTGDFTNSRGVELPFAVTGSNSMVDFVSTLTGVTEGLQFRWVQPNSLTDFDVNLTLQQPTGGILESIRVGNNAPGSTQVFQNAAKDFTLSWPGGGTAILTDPDNNITSHNDGAIITSGTTLTAAQISVDASTWFLDINLSGVTGPVTITYESSTTSAAIGNEGIAFVPVVLTDTDGDGVHDGCDFDSDNDGISDLVESGQNAALVDTDGNGIHDGPVDPLTGIPLAANGGAGVDPVDTDGDGVADYLDLDSDNDGIADAIEAQPTAGYQTPAIGSDADGDGVVDTFDDPSVVHGGAFTTPEDTDGDGIFDFRDTDSDNDFISDTVESGLVGDLTGIDANGDGIDDGVAPDSYADTDGIISDPASELTNEDTDDTDVDYRSLNDKDWDGVADNLDADIDGDGILNSDETTFESLTIDPADLGLAVNTTDNTGSVDVSTQFGYPAGSIIVNFFNTNVNANGTFTLSEVDAPRFVITGSVPVQLGLLHGAGIPTQDAQDGLISHDGQSYTVTSPLDPQYVVNNSGDTYTVQRTGTDASANSTPFTWISDGFASDITITTTNLSPNNAYSFSILAPVDTDGDGVHDGCDIDSDNDGISDLLESGNQLAICLLYTSPSPRDRTRSRMPSSA